MEMQNRKIQIIFGSQYSDDIIELIEKISLVPITTSYEDTIRILMQKTQTDDSDYQMMLNIKVLRS